MENKNNYKNARFDSYLNKIIIFSSKGFHKKQMSIVNKERTIVNDDDYEEFLSKFVASKSMLSLEDSIELNSAIHTLSVIEQAVIFLLFKRQLNQEEAAKILEICSKSVSRIKIRAISKLKKYMEGDHRDGK